MLCRSHDIRRRHVQCRTYVTGDLANPPAADLFLLELAQVMRITNDAAFRSSKGDIHDGAFPGHPHGKRAHRIQGLQRVEPDPAFAGTAGVVMLHPEALEYFPGAVIHPDRDCERILADRRPEQFARGSVEVQLCRHVIEL